MKTKILVFIVTTILITACGNQPAETPASPPTDKPVSATEVTTPSQEPDAVSFSNDIMPILQNSCLNCHGGERIKEGLSVKTYAELMVGSDNGPVVVPGSADKSVMVELLLNKKMPKKGPKLTASQTQLIIDWINQGALDN